MTISMYQASVPVFNRALTNTKAMLQKAAAHAQAKKIDESVLLNARLYPDMLPFTKQVQIASDFARGTSARLSGVEPPAFEDNEKSFAELIAYAAETRELCAGTVLGSGTVSNAAYREVGSSCIAERRGIEILDQGSASTPYMSFGDHVRMEARTSDGGPLFGAIEQRIIKA